jgi:hypothetical protein
LPRPSPNSRLEHPLARFREIVHAEASNDDNPRSRLRKASASVLLRHRRIADVVGKDQARSGVQRVVVFFAQALIGCDRPSKSSPRPRKFS